MILHSEKSDFDQTFFTLIQTIVLIIWNSLKGFEFNFWTFLFYIKLKLSIY